MKQIGTNCQDTFVNETHRNAPLSGGLFPFPFSQGLSGEKTVLPVLKASAGPERIFPVGQLLTHPAPGAPSSGCFNPLGGEASAQELPWLELSLQILHRHWVRAAFPGIGLPDL